MRDPTRRPPGSWPRDRPVRWGALARNLTWFVGASAAALLQLGLAIPVLAVGSSEAGDGLGGFVGIGLTLAWAALTLFAAWSWVLGRWRVVIAPVVTVALIVVATTFGT